MNNWLRLLRFDPLPGLNHSSDTAVEFFTRCDLLDEPAGSVESLWQLPEAVKILKKQQPDGSWQRPGENKHPAINTALIETWKQFRILVGKYALNRENPQARRAAEFFFQCQTEAGDFRGFLANQYATYYTGAVLALLIQAGYETDARVEKGLRWLLSMRQDDGGWSIPILTRYFDGKTIYRLTSEFVEPVEPDRSQPFSHNWTGMVLRAFALHPNYRESDAVRNAANLLKSRFFQKDVYTSYQSASYWVRFDYPFWWSNLLTALDSLSLIGVSVEDEQVATGVQWFVENQCEDGQWNVTYAKDPEDVKENSKTREKRVWVSLAVCRMLKRFAGNQNRMKSSEAA